MIISAYLNNESRQSLSPGKALLFIGNRENEKIRKGAGIDETS